MRSPRCGCRAAGGAAEIAHAVRTDLHRHAADPRSFVSRARFPDDPRPRPTGRERRELGIRTRGPTLLVTDLCIMRPEPETQRNVVVTRCIRASPANRFARTRAGPCVSRRLWRRRRRRQPRNSKCFANCMRGPRGRTAPRAGESKRIEVSAIPNPGSSRPAHTRRTARRIRRAPQQPLIQLPHTLSRTDRSALRPQSDRRDR